MKFTEFTGEVQHRLELGGQGEAVRATRAVLTTLGERLPEGHATNLAAPLPTEIDYYLLAADHGQRFDHGEFVTRVADRAAVDSADAAFHAQAVVALVADILPAGELDDLRAALPADYEDLFELVEADSTHWASS